METEVSWVRPFVWVKVLFAVATLLIPIGEGNFKPAREGKHFPWLFIVSEAPNRSPWPFVGLPDVI